MFCWENIGIGGSYGELVRGGEVGGEVFCRVGGFFGFWWLEVYVLWFYCCVMEG